MKTKRKADKEYGNMWEPTGGLVQSGETSIEGIIRELKEEIGIIANVNDLKLYKTNVEKGNVNVKLEIKETSLKIVAHSPLFQSRTRTILTKGDE